MAIEHKVNILQASLAAADDLAIKGGYTRRRVVQMAVEDPEHYIAELQKYGIDYKTRRSFLTQNDPAVQLKELLLRKTATQAKLDAWTRLGEPLPSDGLAHNWFVQSGEARKAGDIPISEKLMQRVHNHMQEHRDELHRLELEILDRKSMSVGLASK